MTTDIILECIRTNPAGVKIGTVGIIVGATVVPNVHLRVKVGSDVIPVKLDDASRYWMARRLQRRPQGDLMKIYLAGASLERHEISKYIKTLKDVGAAITFDWTAAIEADGGKANEGLVWDRRRELAKQALDAVRAADVVWLLLPTTSTIGAWVELGAAFAFRHERLSKDTSGKPYILVSGVSPDRTIFTSLSDFTYDTHEEACRAISTW